MLVAIAYNVLVLSCVESKIKKNLFSIKKKPWTKLKWWLLTHTLCWAFTELCADLFLGRYFIIWFLMTFSRSPYCYFSLPLTLCAFICLCSPWVLHYQTIGYCHGPWSQSEHRRWVTIAADTMYFRHRVHRTFMGLTWKTPPWRLTFMELEDLMQVSKGGKQPVVLANYYAYEPKNVWQDTATLRAQWWYAYLVVTNCSIDVRNDHQKGSHSWYWKPSQLPTASEIMDLGGGRVNHTCFIGNIIPNDILNIYP